MAKEKRKPKINRPKVHVGVNIDADVHDRLVAYIETRKPLEITVANVLRAALVEFLDKHEE